MTAEIYGENVDPETVKSIRRQAGLSVAEAAAIIGAAPRTWYCWEAGTRNMPAAKWRLFCLLTRKNSMKPGTVDRGLSKTAAVDKALILLARRKAE